MIIGGIADYVEFAGVPKELKLVRYICLTAIEIAILTIKSFLRQPKSSKDIARKKLRRLLKSKKLLFKRSSRLILRRRL